MINPMIDLTERFEALIIALQRWRDEDHEAAILLARSDIIDILEGVKIMRATLKRQGDNDD